MTEQNFTPPIVPPRSRVKEPSTWAGIGLTVLGTIFGARHPELADPTFWGSVATAVTGIMAIFLREKK